MLFWKKYIYILHFLKFDTSDLFCAGRSYFTLDWSLKSNNSRWTARSRKVADILSLTSYSHSSVIDLRNSNYRGRVLKAFKLCVETYIRMSHLIPEIRLLKRCKTTNLNRVSSRSQAPVLRRDSDSPSDIVWVTGFHMRLRNFRFYINKSQDATYSSLKYFLLDALSNWS